MQSLYSMGYEDVKKIFIGLIFNLGFILTAVNNVKGKCMYG